MAKQLSDAQRASLERLMEPDMLVNYLDGMYALYARFHQNGTTIYGRPGDIKEVTWKVLVREGWVEETDQKFIPIFGKLWRISDKGRAALVPPGPPCAARRSE